MIKCFETKEFRVCPICKKSFSIGMIKIHINLHCPFCKKLFMTSRNLTEHVDTHLAAIPLPIVQNDDKKDGNDDNELMPTTSFNAQARTNAHIADCQTFNTNENLTIRKSDFKGRVATYKLLNRKEEILLPEEFFKNAKNLIITQLKECSIKHTIFKYNMHLLCEYLKMVNDDMTVAQMVHVSKMTLITLSDDINNSYDKHADEITSKMGEFQERDSGWTLIKIDALEININKCSIIKGSQFIPLPVSIANNKGACINIKNEDVFCFKWCLIAALYCGLTNIQKRICNSYDVNIEDEKISIRDLELNFKGLTFPLPLKELKKFEKQNEVSVNVFGYNDGSIVGPYYITIDEKPIHINLLLLNADEKSHYVLINDISRLIRRSITLHKSKIFVCNMCLYHTHIEAAFKNHKSVCGKKIVKMPTAEDAYISFKNHQKQLDVPFVIYGDFESILEKTNENVSSSTTNIQKHIPCAFSYFIKCSFNKNYNKQRYYFGENASKVFVQEIVKDARVIYEDHLSKVKEIVMTIDDIDIFNKSTDCHIC